MAHEKYYALYQGDKLIPHGTKKEISAATGITISYMSSMQSKSRKHSKYDLVVVD